MMELEQSVSLLTKMLDERRNKSRVRWVDHSYFGLPKVIFHPRFTVRKRTYQTYRSEADRCQRCWYMKSRKTMVCSACRYDLLNPTHHMSIGMMDWVESIEFGDIAPVYLVGLRKGKDTNAV